MSTNNNLTSLFYERKEETEILDTLFNNRNQSTLIGIDGKRRSGKTVFTNKYIHDKSIELSEKNQKVCFLSFIGNPSLSSRENVINNLEIIKSNYKQLGEEYIKYTGNYNWRDFFAYLKEIIDDLHGKKPDYFVFIFFDEISWYDKKNMFIQQFANFWNTYGHIQNKLWIFLASSASIWMRDKVFENENSFYNRITRKIKIEPFSFNQIKEYVKMKTNLNQINDEYLLKYYMMFGGIIKYYDYIDFKFKTFEENIKTLINNENFFLEEYDILFKGLVANENSIKSIELHKKIIEILCKKKSTKFDEIKKLLPKKINNSVIYTSLTELENCDMIRISDKEFGGKKQYNINDPFCFFYYYWINKKTKKRDLKNIIQMNTYYTTWLGSAFEIMIFQKNNLKDILKTNSLDEYTTFLNWNSGNKQIDILLEKKTVESNKKRNFVLLELKCYKQEMNFGSKEIKELENKAIEVISNFRKLQKNEIKTDVFVDIKLISLYKISLSDDISNSNIKLEKHNLIM